MKSKIDVQLRPFIYISLLLLEPVLNESSLEDIQEIIVHLAKEDAKDCMQGAALRDKNLILILMNHFLERLKLSSAEYTKKMRRLKAQLQTSM